GRPREKKAERGVREEEALDGSSGGGAEAIPVVHVDSEILFRSSLITLPFLFVPRLPRLFFLVSLSSLCDLGLSSVSASVASRSMCVLVLD
uniref:Uncharacterized protein n=1 Tax=Aegilops tauschii subsp. strangulata TaxID=200361 RepID=A0A453FDM0_AEGTS